MQPDVAMILELVAAMGLPPTDTLSAADARALMAATAATRPPGPEVGEVTDGVIPGPAGDLPYRLYRPAGPSRARAPWWCTSTADEWVINGEKWFTSAGRVADLLFVMCTNGMFVVPRVTPGVEIMPEPRNHNHIVYRDVRVPLDHLLGPENGARVLAQRRLGGGRIHHAMRTIAQCKLAFDIMCERALSRESHGSLIAEHQMVHLTSPARPRSTPAAGEPTAGTQYHRHLCRRRGRRSVT